MLKILTFESVQRLGEHCSEEREGRTAEQDTERQNVVGHTRCCIS